MSRENLMRGLFGNSTKVVSLNTDGKIETICNSGTNLNTSALALESGGNLASLASCVSGSEIQVDVVNTPTVTANSGTNLNTSALALESGGNLASLASCVSGSEIQVDVVSGSVSTSKTTTSTTQTLTPAALGSASSSALDTDGFSRVAYIIESDTDSVQCQLKWSHNDSTYYQLESFKVVSTINDQSGANPQYTTYFNVDCVSKYVKLSVYNPSGGAASVVVNSNRF